MVLMVGHGRFLFCIYGGTLYRVDPTTSDRWPLSEGWEGASRMKDGLDRIVVEQPPVDQSLQGSSSWLRVAREKAAERRMLGPAADPGKLVIARVFKRARKLEPASAPLAAEPSAALAEQAVSEHTAVFATPTPAEVRKPTPEEKS